MTQELSTRSTLAEIIDGRPMGRRRIAIVVVAFLTMIAEGLDITIVSNVYPEIVRGWQTPISTITFTVTLGVLAMAIGGIAAGPAADRWGRKVVVVTSVALFGSLTAGVGLAPTIEWFAALRILSCFGLGAVLPAVMAIVADWMPAARRAQMVTLSFAGVALGSILGGYLAALIIPRGGWGMLMIVAGAVPLVLLPLIVLVIPESPTVLLARGRSEQSVQKLIESVLPDAGPVLVGRPAPTPATAGESVGQGTFATILSRTFLPRTILVWLMFFIGLGSLFMILNYLPLMLSSVGLGAAQIGIVVATFGWGGLIGQVGSSFLVRRFDRFRLVALLWAFGIIGLLTVGLSNLNYTGFVLVAFAIGLALPSVSAVLNAIAALTYPSSAQATGLGAASAAGRLGTLTSGLLGGMAIAAGWSISSIFLVLTLPIGIGVVAVLGLRSLTAGTQRRAETTLQVKEYQ